MRAYYNNIFLLQNNVSTIEYMSILQVIKLYYILQKFTTKFLIHTTKYFKNYYHKFQKRILFLASL